MNNSHPSMMAEWTEWWEELEVLDSYIGLGCMWNVEKLKRELKKGVSDRLATKILRSCCENADTKTNPEALQVLVDSGRVDVNATIDRWEDVESATPLMIVGSQFPLLMIGEELKLKALQILLRAGANINARNSESFKGFNTLMLCAYRCNFEPSIFPVFNALIQNGSDINVRVQKASKWFKMIQISKGFGVLELLYSRDPSFLADVDVRKKYVEAIFERAEYRMSKVKRGSAAMYEDLELFFAPTSAVALKRYLKKDKRFESEDLIKEICSFVCYTSLVDVWTIPRKRKRSKMVKARKKKKR